MVVDVWMQHPTRGFLAHEMFDTLPRWSGRELPDEEPPIEVTVAAMDHAGVTSGS